MEIMIYLAVVISPIVFFVMLLFFGMFTIYFLLKLYFNDWHKPDPAFIVITLFAVVSVIAYIIVPTEKDIQRVYDYQLKQQVEILQSLGEKE